MRARHKIAVEAELPDLPLEHARASEVVLQLNGGPGEIVLKCPTTG